MNKGKTVLQGNLKEIKDTYKANKIYVSAKQDISEFIKEIGLNIIIEKDNDYEIEISDEEQGYKLFDLLAKNNLLW